MQKKEERMDIAEVLARRRPQRIAKRAMDIVLSAAALAVLGLVLISFVLPAVLTWLIAIPLRKWGWIKDGDLKLQ